MVEGTKRHRVHFGGGCGGDRRRKPSSFVVICVAALLFVSWGFEIGSVSAFTTATLGGKRGILKKGKDTTTIVHTAKHNSILFSKRNSLLPFLQRCQSPPPTTTTRTTSFSSSLRMSSIEDDLPDQPPSSGNNSNNNGNTNNLAENRKTKKTFNWRRYLPSPPEDQLAMSGDVAALFVYSFLDHGLNDLYVAANTYDISSTSNPADFFIAASHLDPNAFGALLGLDSMDITFPVWFDVSHLTGPMIASIVPTTDVVYAPAISTAGISSVLIVTAWLVSGYINEAFTYENTLECDTRDALLVTFRTWIMAAIMMVVVAVWSDAYCGCLVKPSLGGLTKADADYIFDSFSVLVVWRVLLNMLLGYSR